MLVENGRPVHVESRLEKEQKVYHLLDELQIPYLRADHEAAMTMEACEEVDRALEASLCKNLFLCNRQQTDFYLLLMPGNKPFKTKALSAQIGSSRLSFANEDHMGQFLNITPGSVSILGLMNDHNKTVRLLIDQDLLQEHYFCCHPCINTSSIRILTSDLLEKLIPALAHEPTIVTLP